MFNSKKDPSENKLNSEFPRSSGLEIGPEETGPSEAEGQRALQEIMQNRHTSVYSMRGGPASDSANELALSSASGNMTIGPGVKMEGAIRNFKNLMILGSSEGELEGENLIIGEGGWLKGTATICNMEVVGNFGGIANVTGHKSRVSADQTRRVRIIAGSAARLIGFSTRFDRCVGHHMLTFSWLLVLAKTDL